MKQNITVLPLNYKIHGNLLRCSELYTVSLSFLLGLYLTIKKIVIS